MNIQRIVARCAEHEAYFGLDAVHEVLAQIADTLAPSQTAACTRAPAIDRILETFNLSDVLFDQNYKGTGNGLLCSIHTAPSILFIAHIDQISYLIDQQKSNDTWQLLPYCKHLSRIETTAIALRYSIASDAYVRVARGVLYSEVIEGELTPFFRILEGELQVGDRIVYEHPLERDGDCVVGNIDNAAGATACLIAANALYRAFPRINIGFVFSDEEEGPSSNPMFFARGVRRLMRTIPMPEACVIIDGHGGRNGQDIGKGTFFTEKTGGGTATVTPPKLFATVKALAQELQAIDVFMFEDLGRVSRSDDIPCLDVTANVIAVGYPSVNRHYDNGFPAASLKDIQNLAKTIFCLAATLGSADE